MSAAALIGAGASILGGLLGSKSASKDRALQVEMAKNAIQWRVEDAKKAGIHPLSALGAATPGYAPVGDGGLGNAVGQAGEQISRSLDPLNKAQLDVLRSEAERNRAEAANQVAAARSRTIIAARRNVAIGGTGINDMRPPPRPTVELRFPGDKGKPFTVPADVARQYNLKNGDHVSHDLVEQLVGDLASELFAPAFVSGYDKFSRRWGGTGFFDDGQPASNFYLVPGGPPGNENYEGLNVAP